MWVKDRLAVDNYVTNLGDIAIRYRNIDFILDTNPDFNYEIMTRLLGMGYSYVWMPILAGDYTLFDKIIRQLKFNQKKLLVFSSGTEKHKLKAIKKHIEILKL